jgi:TolA-binding protein
MTVDDKIRNLTDRIEELEAAREYDRDRIEALEESRKNAFRTQQYFGGELALIKAYFLGMGLIMLFVIGWSFFK